MSSVVIRFVLSFALFTLPEELLVTTRNKAIGVMFVYVQGRCASSYGPVD
jgi:hypothetical protein